MGNCLITKLKETVDNDTLLKVGEVRLKIFPALAMNSAIQQTATNLSSGEEIVFFANSSKYFGGETGQIVSIPNKYKIKALYYSGTIPSGFKTELNLDGLKYTDTLEIIMIPGVVGDISNLADKENLTTVNIRSANGVYGNISALQDKSHLREIHFDLPHINGDINVLSNDSALTTLFIEGSEITGTITTQTFSAMTTLSTLELMSSKISGNISTLLLPISVTEFRFNGSTQIDGSIEDFAALQCASRNSGNINLYVNGVVSYHGVTPAAISTFPITFNQNGCVVTNTRYGTGTYDSTTGTWSYS